MLSLFPHAPPLVTVRIGPASPDLLAARRKIEAMPFEKLKVYSEETTRRYWAQKPTPGLTYRTVYARTVLRMRDGYPLPSSGKRPFHTLPYGSDREYYRLRLIVRDARPLRTDPKAPGLDSLAAIRDLLKGYDRLLSDDPNDPIVLIMAADNNSLYRLGSGKKALDYARRASRYPAYRGAAAASTAIAAVKYAGALPQNDPLLPRLFQEARAAYRIADQDSKAYNFKKDYLDYWKQSLEFLEKRHRNN